MIEIRPATAKRIAWIAGIGEIVLILAAVVFVAVATTVTTADAPFASVPRVHVTVGPPAQLPTVAVAETKPSSAGSGSVSVTFVAAPGPWLETVSLNVTCAPTVTLAAPGSKPPEQVRRFGFSMFYSHAIVMVACTPRPCRPHRAAPADDRHPGCDRSWRPA